MRMKERESQVQGRGGFNIQCWEYYYFKLVIYFSFVGQLFRFIFRKQLFSVIICQVGRSEFWVQGGD